MISKAELQAVLDEMSTEMRKQRPEPPTVEEMLAYRSGELSPGDEARVRALLVCYPELLRALMLPPPSDEPQPGDPDYLSPEIIERQLKALHSEIDVRRGGNVVPFRAALSAIAAALALIFGTFYWYARAEQRMPRAISIDDAEQLQPGGSRGADGPVKSVSPQGDVYVLVLAINDLREFASYRVEMRDASGHRSLWSMSGVPRSGQKVAVIVPRSFLQGGKRYMLELYGVTAGGEDLMGTYEFATDAPRR